MTEEQQVNVKKVQFQRETVDINDIIVSEK